MIPLVYLLLAKITAVAKIVALKICGNNATGARNSVKINLIRSLGCVIVSLVVWAFSSRVQMDGVGVWLSLLSGVSNALLLCTWILAAERTSLCVVELFSMLGAVALPLLLAPLLYEGERVSALQWCGVALLFISVFFFTTSTPKEKSEEKTPKQKTTYLLLILCSLANAGAVISQKLFMTYAKGNVANFQLWTFAVVAFLFGCIFLTFSAKKNHKKNREAETMRFSVKVWIGIGVATVMLYASQFFSTKASAAFPSAIFYPLSYAVSMPLTFLSDVFIFHEKVTFRKLLALLFIACSILLIHL